MQLPVDDGRAVRMILALLNAADPLGRLDQGDLTSSYEPLSVVVLAALRDGADTRRLVLLINEHGRGGVAAVPLDLGPVFAFARAVTDWWAESASRVLGSVAS